MRENVKRFTYSGKSYIVEECRKKNTYVRKGKHTKVNHNKIKKRLETAKQSSKKREKINKKN